MPYEFVFYPDPPSGLITVKPDSGGAYTSVPYSYTDGRPGQCAYVADNTPDNQGALLQIAADGYAPVEMRGFLRLYPDTMTARLEVDDYNMTPANAAPGPTPPPSGPPNPFEICTRVYNETHPQLWTKEGCGLYVEDCVTALHNEASPYFGHVRKFEGQNQYNGHAVDAVHLALNIPGTNAGIYDIIFSSVSAEAKPAWNYAGPPEYDLWYYPAEDATKTTPVFVLRVPDRR